MAIFPDVPKIKYEGPDSTDPLSSATITSNT